MRRVLYILVGAILFNGCGKGGGGGSDAVPAPDKANLLFPSQNSVCVTGTSPTGSLSTVAFSWTAANNADRYELDIKNLLTSVVTKQTVVNNSATMALNIATPYSWFVISKSSQSAVTTQSDTWKFYNSAPGITYYAPFPADLAAPYLNQTITATNGKIDMSWQGSSTDNNIIGYDVYLGTSSTTLTLLQANVTNMFLKQVAVTVGVTYYWKVVTKDSQGNTSDSNIYPFTVK